jgi:hypothetical protein
MVMEKVESLAYVPKRIAYRSLEKVRDIPVIVLCIEEIFNPLAHAFSQTFRSATREPGRVGCDLQGEPASLFYDDP